MLYSIWLADWLASGSGFIWDQTNLLKSRPLKKLTAFFSKLLSQQMWILGKGGVPFPSENQPAQI